jgi:lysophospholipid acyltransferase (LPLAT)-like uncharacterized protein
VRFEEGQERIADLLAREEPVILCAWHNRIFFLGGFLESQLTRKGFKLTQMVSLSRDGDIGYRLGKWAKLNVVRGSSNRGGSKALRGLFRVIHKEKSSIIILPDGSQGPVYEAKAGPLYWLNCPERLFIFSLSKPTVAGGLNLGSINHTETVCQNLHSNS